MGGGGAEASRGGFNCPNPNIREMGTIPCRDQGGVGGGGIRGNASKMSKTNL